MTENEKALKNLLGELKNNRESLHVMLEDIGSFRSNLDVLLPKTGGKVDFKNRHLLAERMKTVTEIIKGELAVRSQIDSSIKLETDMRKKTGEEETTDLPNQIRTYAKALELMEENRKKLEKKDLKLVKQEEG